MSDTVIHRLSKIAKELNVSVATIAEFLKGKGHTIVVNPNTKISNELYDLLLEGFGAEKKDKEESKRIQEQKEKRKNITVEETPSISDITSKKREEDELVIRNMAEDVIRAPKPQEFTIKEVGKIDLESITKKKKEETAKKHEEPVKEKAAEQVKKEEKPSHIPVPEPEKYKTTFSKLEGPTIVGKIELPVEKTTSQDDFDKKKKKKRIKKQKVQQDEYARFASDASKKSEAAKSQSQLQHQQRRRSGSGRRREARPEVTEEEVQSQIKETLSRLSGTGKSRAAKYRKMKREAMDEKLEQQAQLDEAEKQILKVTEFIAVSQ
ncbi:MAG TPA: hypothetical protein VII99_15110, partial [Bacteroidia bacterium]